MLSQSLKIMKEEMGNKGIACRVQLHLLFVVCNRGTFSRVMCSKPFDV